MKKYFFDRNYNKFTRRLFTVLSVIAGGIGFIVGVQRYYPLFPIFLMGVCFATVIWILYGLIRWILAALPDE